jgi:hypothetical protein
MKSALLFLRNQKRGGFFFVNFWHSIILKPLHMHLTKQSVKQTSNFFFALFSILLFSCNNASAVKQEDQQKQDSLIGGLTPKALSKKLHEFTFREIKMRQINPGYETVIRDVYPDGKNWLVSFVDSSFIHGGIILNGIVLLDKNATITDFYYSPPSVPGVHAGFQEFFSVKFNTPELELNYTIYHADAQGEIYLYDSVYTKFHKVYPDSMFRARPGDVPEKYIDTFRLKQYFIVSAGKLKAKE